MMTDSPSLLGLLCHYFTLNLVVVFILLVTVKKISAFPFVDMKKDLTMMPLSVLVRLPQERVSIGRTYFFVTVGVEIPKVSSRLH